MADIEWKRGDDAFHFKLLINYNMLFVDRADLSEDGRRLLPPFENAPWHGMSSRHKHLVHCMNEEARPWLSAAIVTMSDRQVTAKVIMKTRQPNSDIRRDPYKEEVFEADWKDITFHVEFVAFYRLALWHFIAKIIQGYNREEGEQLKEIMSVEVIFRVKRPVATLA